MFDRVWNLALGLLVVVGLSGVAHAQAPDAPLSAAPIDAAFRSAQLAVAPGAGPALAEGAARVAAGDPALLALFDASRKAEQERRALETVLVTLRAQGSQAQARAQGVAGDLDRAVVLADAARDRLQTAYPRFVDLLDPAPLDIAEVQALLGPTDALVLILPAARGTYVWAVTPTTSQWARSDLTESQITDLAQTLVQSLTAGSGRGAVDAARRTARARQTFAADAAWRLYDALWKPLEPVLTGVQTVYLVSDGPLRSVPPGALLTAPPVTGGSVNGAAWLQRRHAFVALPTVANLRGFEQHAERSSRAFVGYGDAITRGFPDGAVAKSLPALPQTRPELQRLARTLGASRGSIQLGRAATEASLKAADLQGVSVVALATHAVSSVEEAGETTDAYLVFTPPAQIVGMDDGRLTATEAAGLRLTADLVILSACDTARDDPEATGIDSLARALLFAGARSLLVSNWRIRDDVAARLSTRAVELSVREQVGIAQALQLATLEMMDDRRDASLADPSNWAAFSILGDGSVQLAAAARP